MTRSILKRPQAERDIEECFVYIGSGNLDAALRFLDAIEDSLETISENPLIGSPREFYNIGDKNLRMWLVTGFENYEIFYLVEDEIIDVVRVLHSARDLEGIFGD